MICKAVKGRGFKGALAYDLNSEKGRVIDSNMAASSINGLSSEFGEIRKLKPKLEKAVLHVSISAAPGERLSDEQWQTIGQKYLEGMGFTNNQYIMTRHEDTDHEHIHILANRISNDGQVVSDSQDYKRQTVIMRQLEKEFGLRQLDPSKESGRKSLRKSEIEKSLRTNEPNIRLLMQKVASEALKKSSDLVQYAKNLNSRGIELIASFQQDGKKLSGLVYEKDGFRLKGSDLGKSFTPSGLSKKGLSYEQNGQVEFNGYLRDRKSERSNEGTGTGVGERFSQEIKRNINGNGESLDASYSIAGRALGRVSYRKQKIESRDNETQIIQSVTDKKNEHNAGRDDRFKRSDSRIDGLADTSSNQTPYNSGRDGSEAFSGDKVGRARADKTEDKEEIKPKSKGVEW